tara:strand:- start:6444 stop:7556 length:1113 start_codon:yes stop_codon:yes gene_type:complete
MIIIISCNHFPDDERIYYKQICSLKEQEYPIKYFTRSDSIIDMSDSLVDHINYSKDISIQSFIKIVYQQISRIQKISHVQIHETELLPIFKKVKYGFSKSPITIYDVHENIEALYRTFSNRIKLLKEVLIYWRKYKEKKNLKYVDKIILANKPVNDFPYSEIDKEIVVIENYPEIERIRKNSINQRKKNSIIYHGHLGEERGIKDLIYAINHIKTSFSNILLTLVGTFRTKEFQREITSLIEQLDLKQTVEIVEQVPHSKIWELLDKHCVGVIPFRENPLTQENTPTKLFEMMASGLEIVTSDLRPIRQFVQDSVLWSEPGSFISMANAIKRALNGTGNPQHIAYNYNLIEKKYNWEKRKELYLSLFSIR